MNKAAAAFGVAGFAAAATILASVRAPSAPARGAGADAPPCSAGSHPGQIVQNTAFLTLNGRRSDKKAAFVQRNQRVGTTSRGKATLCLSVTHTKCTLEAGTELRLLPATGTLARLNFGSIKCATRQGRRTWAVETRAETIKLAAVDTVAETRHSTGLRADGENTSGHLLAIVARGNKTTVKVRRGATVVAHRGDDKTGVLVGRDKQVTVVGSQAPPAPRDIQLNAAERRAFAQLQASLPPLRDKKAPEVELTRSPRKDGSSQRRPRFEFSATEANSVFSCSLDGGTFTVCTSPFRLSKVEPGSHRFAVVASDLTGNLGRPLVFQWSVDSSRILFAREFSGGNIDIFSMDTAGGEQRNLTNNPAEDSAPSWSPDRTQVAFHTNRAGTFDIYAMNADGSNPRVLAKSPSFDKNPDWSSRGEIVFESARDGNSELYVMDGNGGNVRRLTNDPAADFDPAWSADGTQIAFASRRRGENYDIWLMNADGSNQHILLADPHIEFNPSWSRDGTHIAFHSDRDGVSSQIWLIRSDGTGLTRLTKTNPGTGAFDFNPVWAPDGETLAFQSNLHEQDDIYIVNSDGTDVTRLTDAAEPDRVPDW